MKKVRGRRTQLKNIKQPLFDNLISSFSFWQFLNVFDLATSGNADTKTAETETRVRRMTL